MNGSTCRCERPHFYNKLPRKPPGLLWCGACDCRVADAEKPARKSLVWWNDHSWRCCCFSCVLGRSSRAYA